jgi:serine/threonine protein kinase
MAEASVHFQPFSPTFLTLPSPSPFQTPPPQRDLKPANLMIGGGPIEAASDPSARRVLLNELGVLKIADFGLSKSLKLQLQRAGGANGMAKPDTDGGGGGGPHTSYKMTGETGSYRYMAPEVGGLGLGPVPVAVISDSFLVVVVVVVVVFGRRY